MRAVLAAITVLVPIVALLLQFMDGAGMSERHHRHHDSYSVSVTFLRTLVLVMAFMSLLGLLLSWLCSLGAYSADDTVLLAFFCTFVVVTFFMWLGMRRYRVVTYEDYMTIRPVLGPSCTVRYEQVDRMERLRPNSFTGHQSVRVYVGGGRRRRVRLWGMVGVEQILIRVNRFDVLDSSAV